MNYLHQNCPYAYPERDENYTLIMCRLHPEKIWGVEEKDCEWCPKCPDKDWQAWKHSLHGETIKNDSSREKARSDI